jgi:hypothetical protein
MGRNVTPTTKFEAQFAAVERPEPRLLTFSGKSSDCCQGTFPIPIPYAATYRVILASTTKGDERSVNGTLERPSGVAAGLEEFVSLGRVMKWKATPQRRRAKIMTGMDERRIRRRPMRSISRRERTVKTKFVTATDSEARVGLEKPMRENRVAEKYMREFCVTECEQERCSNKD